MKQKSKLSRFVSAFTTAVMCIIMLPKASVSAASVGEKLNVGNGTNQHKGNCDGYSYEVWLDNTGGSGSMTLGQGASFKAEWSASVSQGNFLARRGLDFGSQKKATDYPYIGMDYDATYSQTGSGGNSRLCVYGWFENRNAAGNPPLVEYYIIEDWVNWRPTANGASTTVTIDGGQYEIFAIDHTGPTIHGNTETFKQYFSVRKDTRTSGHITVSDHFKAWADQGWGIGNLYEVALNAEGWESSGVADVKMLDVYTDPDKRDPSVDPGTPSTPSAEPDENGYFFHSTFEDGTDSWNGRGDAKAVQSGSAANSGSKSLAVSGRTDSWNGAAISLDPTAFEAGKTYAFSANAMQNTTASEDFKLTLQCTIDGEENYIGVAETAGAKGEWVQLVNNSFTIPAGASNLLLYVETIDSTTDFYIDDVIGALEGKIKAEENPLPADYIIGDLNGDKVIDSFDVVLERQAIINMFAGTKTPPPAADINSDGKVGMDDLVLLSQYVLAQIKKFPDPPVTTTTKATTTTTTKTTPTTVKPNTGDPTSYMDKVRASMTNNVPASATNGSSDYGTLEKITYFSSTAGRNKTANVLLPDGYSTSEKYPVLYVNHGIFGDENSMLTGMSVRELAGNLVKSGEAEKMIIVFPQMFSSNTMTSPGGMDQATCVGYDMFLDDLTKDLMPYIEKNYSIKTGRENTAISGFSMGGRESLYIGVMRPDLFGYIGAACPAPGVTPGSDMFMSHPGNMQESEFKITDTANYPYLWLITGGTNDSVVGTFPKQYHETLTTNGQDHIWQEIQGGGHDASCVVPMMYNFMRNIFKA